MKSVVDVNSACSEVAVSHVEVDVVVPPSSSLFFSLSPFFPLRCNNHPPSGTTGGGEVCKDYS